jgi:hypothetical protein
MLALVADLDEPRFAGRSELGYVTERYKAMLEEPEAVSASEQRRLTVLAQRAQRERLRAEWAPVLADLDAFLALTLPRGVAHRAARLAQDAKLVDRELRAI